MLLNFTRGEQRFVSRKKNVGYARCVKATLLTPRKYVGNAEVCIIKLGK